MKHRFVLAAALIAFSPLAAAAQFTSVIVPPKKERPVVVAQQAAQRDSVQQVKLTDMKEWVDSAATALTAKGPQRTDSVAIAARTAPVQATAPHHAVESSKSTTLPDTASPLPFIALLGFGMVTAGLLMLRKRA